jgi:hypothetical protein
VQSSALERLWAFLGLDAIWSDRIDYFLPPERSKLNSPATYRLPNADEIERDCGADTTGHLLRHGRSGLLVLQRVQDVQS